jgi:hypothetical protein
MMAQYGFYSATADQQHGHAVWLTPSGQKVLVTCVSDFETPLEAGYNWADVYVMGEVTECVVANSMPLEEWRHRFNGTRNFNIVGNRVHLDERMTLDEIPLYIKNIDDEVNGE